MVMVMTVERSWDLYEIALLIELYLDIQEGKIARGEGIQKLSGTLRQRARTLGYEVGPRFRNINGVSFMLSSLTTLFTDGKRGSIRPPQIFKQTYKLYTTNRSRFATILRIAHEQCAKDFTPKLLQLNKDILTNDAVDKVEEKTDDIKLTTVENYANNNHESGKELSASGNNKTTKSENSNGTPVMDLVSEQLKFLTFCTSKHQVQIKTLAHYIVRLNNLFLDKKIIKQGVFSEQDLEALKALRQNDNWKPLLGEAFTGGALLLASLYFFYLLEYLEAQEIKEPVAKEVQEKPQAENVSVSDDKPSAASVESVIDEKETVEPDIVGKPADRTENSTSNIISQTKIEDTDGEINDLLLQTIKKDGKQYVDRRSKGGGLWVIGSKFIENYIDKLRDLGAAFKFASCKKAINYDDGWWTKDVVYKVGAIPREQPEKTVEFYDAHDKEAEATSVSTLPLDDNVLDDGKEEYYSVDFTNIADLIYTRPVRFSYFGEEKVCGKSWTDLFVNFVSVMVSEYPDMFTAGMSFSKIGKRIELVKKSDANLMIAPKNIPESDYALETNSSAKDIIAKIKYILELCHVDYENVVIAYEKKDRSSATVSNRENAPVQQTEPAFRNEEYVSAQKAEPVFNNAEYASVLKERFSKGFRMESSLEIRKFRRYYAAQFGKELADSDELVTQNITRMCILHTGKAFLPAIMLSEELKEKLLRYIDDSFASGKKAIYFQALYNHFAQDFLDYPIHDADMLRAYLSHLQLDGVFIKYDFISRERYVNVDPVAEIRQCLQEYARPVEYEELFAALPHIPQDKIRAILHGSWEFVNNGGGAYFHESSLVLSDEELADIAAIIDYYIKDKEFIGGNELYDAIKAKYPYVIENNASYSVNGFRDALKYKLADRFHFKGNIISRPGKTLSMTDVFANYAKRHDSFTLTELQALAGELATGVYFEPVYENSLRISQEQFVARSRARFLVDDTDAALDRICTGDYITIQDVTNFGVFPYAGFTWNSFLLEHYAAYYSHKYKLLHSSSYNSNTCVGAIVKKSAGLDSFDDLVVDLMAHSDMELTKASVLDYLSDKGYIARRSYSNIEALIIKANAQRNRKESD